MELLQEAFPKISHVAVLWETANAGNAVSLREMKVAAEALRITLQPLEFRSPDDFEPAFSTIKKERANASTKEHCHQDALSTDRGPCGQEPLAGDVSGQGIRGRWWPHVLWAEPLRPVSGRGEVRG